MNDTSKQKRASVSQLFWLEFEAQNIWIKSGDFGDFSILACSVCNINVCSLRGCEFARDVRIGSFPRQMPHGQSLRADSLFVGHLLSMQMASMMKALSVSIQHKLRLRLSHQLSVVVLGNPFKGWNDCALDTNLVPMADSDKCWLDGWSVLLPM